MKLEKIINKYCKQYDLIGEDNDLKKEIIHELACELDKLRKKDEKKYKNLVFKLCRKI